MKSKLVAGLKAVLAAEANDPAVHGALRSLQAAVVAAAVVAVKSYLGV